MLLNTYSSLLASRELPIKGLKVAESAASYHVLTERHLQAMWLEQKYFKPLTLNDGTPIEVLSPGIWNSEAGPDFLKAHLKIGGQELFGDIELHLSPDGWFHHHHHEDPRYDQVILHVSYWESAKEKSIYTSKNTPVASTSLQSKLTIPEARLIKLIDLDLYPYKLFSGVGRCSRLLFGKLSQDKAENLFHSAALWRLKTKWQRLIDSTDHPSKCLAAGIAMALGYKHNADAFLAIFNAVGNGRKLDETTCLALFMGAGGFFTPHFQEKWGSSPLYMSLFNAYTKAKTEMTLPRCPLKLDRIRPANHPVRRLALLAKMVAGTEWDSLGHAIKSLWEDAWKSSDTKKWKNLNQSLYTAIPDYDDAYWSRHYTFEAAEQKRSVSLIGPDLKREIVINVFLPYLYYLVERTGSEEELHAFDHFYGSLKAGKTKKSTYLSHRFFGDSPKRICLSQANTQQGAYQIHRDFCIHFEASCQGCPFVEMYHESFGKDK